MDLLTVILLIVVTAIIVLKVAGAFKPNSTGGRIASYVGEGVCLRLATSNETYLRDSELTESQIKSNAKLKALLLDGGEK